MRVEFQLPEQRITPDGCVLTIGDFDGVHRGHRQLIDTAVASAHEHGDDAVVVTFDPHPRCVLHPDDCPASITTLDEKRERLAAAGVDRLIVVTFTREVSQWPAADFCTRLVQGLGFRHLVVGRDFALGHNREGDVDFLRRFGTTGGFETTIVEPLEDGTQPISSSRIRSALTGGDIGVANRLLGYHYFIDATVEHGSHLGRDLGFPTANLSITPSKCLPQRGVYAGWVDVAGGQWMSAINVGYRPTFGGDRLIVEAHLLDFDADIYSARVRVSFTERLREERTYPDAVPLIEQMHHDVAVTRRLLAAGNAPEPAGS